jgi:hypothetical protein
VDAFPASVIGNTYDNWPDERFLDVRQLDILLPLMQARFTRCRDLGFTAVEPDNMDLHINDTGFAIGAGHVSAYVRSLVGIAHGIELQIGQKNAGDLTDRLLPVMDFVITENCMTDGWCDDIAGYAHAGKPIFAAEYDVETGAMAQMCADARAQGISMIFKDVDLHAGGASCP